MATTRVYKSYADFRKRVHVGNGISVEVLMDRYRGDMAAAIADNATNDGCWDCTGCGHCTDCRECADCKDCKDCKHCTDSEGCTDCSICGDCTGCTDCHRCEGQAGLRDAEGITYGDDGRGEAA